ncbi:hypothetical protein SAMN02927921_03395 [Sinomicrobium oceani]|uniref:Uncharacterized protein n=2 Tax=Sinomicrobium oceani TaxID=1150368 RepID=A0A1K1RCH9_9FLAO|nr:hypothetical protein SAMN02927921_03395 [Sinomicrobium oceani]
MEQSDKINDMTMNFTQYNSRKTVVCVLLMITLFLAVCGCDTEGDPVTEETYVTVLGNNFNIIGDNQNELYFFINGDSLKPREYYPDGSELKIEIRKTADDKVLLDSTRIAVFGEEINITAFYTEEGILIPMAPLTEEDKVPAPEGYRKVRFINFIKDADLLEGKRLKLDVYGVYNTGLNPLGIYNQAMTEKPLYTLPEIQPDNFSVFFTIPELETAGEETGQELIGTVAKVYNAATDALILDAYMEEGEVFPGFPEFGTSVNVRGEKRIGNLSNTSIYTVTTIQLQATLYEGVYLYSQLPIEALSE